MAVKGSRKKRKSLDPFFAIVIGIVGLLIVLSISVAIYNRLDNDKYITDWSHLTTKEESGVYFAYFYSDTCPACVEIREDIALFRASNAQNINLYYINASTVKGVKPPELNLQYTPSLIIIRDGVATNLLVGPDEILTLFEDVESGEFE